jgi:hypothetical protein
MQDDHQPRSTFRPILTLGFLLLCATAHLAVAGPVTFTITGTFDSSSISFPAGDPTLATPFDNGSTFSIVFSISSLTPTPTHYSVGVDASTTLPITGSISYTNGSVTATTQSPDNSAGLDSPNSEGFDIGVAMFGVYVPDDVLEFVFSGPLLFFGTTEEPILVPETVQLQQQTVGVGDFEVLYSQDGSNICCGTANIVGNPTLVITPEPAPFVEVSLGLLLLAGIAHRRVARVWNKGRIPL